MFTCVHVESKDYFTKIAGYKLKNKQSGHMVDIEASKLKEMLRAGTISVDNLKLASNGKIVIQEKLDLEEYEEEIYLAAEQVANQVAQDIYECTGVNVGHSIDPTICTDHADVSIVFSTWNGYLAVDIEIKTTRQEFAIKYSSIYDNGKKSRHISKDRTAYCKRNFYLSSELPTLIIATFSGFWWKQNNVGVCRGFIEEYRRGLAH